MNTVRTGRQSARLTVRVADEAEVGVVGPRDAREDVLAGFQDPRLSNRRTEMLINYQLAGRDPALARDFVRVVSFSAGEGTWPTRPRARSPRRLA